MVKIKICGLTRMEDIEAVNRYLPDYAGFVFAKSRRQVTVEQAKRLSQCLERSIIPVGVFVNEEIRVIEDICKRGIIRAVQLHGDEDAEYIEEIKNRLPGITVIKAVRVKNSSQVKEQEKLPCDWLLLDTYKQGTYGGSGEEFDVRMIPELTRPYFLAGGISVHNVEEKLAALSPCAVDVSSAVETEGVKDKKKIKEFIERVRSYE